MGTRWRAVWEKEGQEVERPNKDQIRDELNRTEYGRRYRAALKSTLYTLIVVAAIAILVATLLLPVLRTYGKSMTPTLDDGDIVFSVKTSNVKRGDIIAFYYNNKILIKRVIGISGEWIDIDKDGNVFVNGTALDEPYVTDPALGECNIKLPYQVPENRVFVMGDHRSTSLDSRTVEIGCISEEQIVGKLIFRVWPISVFGGIQ